MFKAVCTLQTVLLPDNKGRRSMRVYGVLRTVFLTRSSPDTGYGKFVSFDKRIHRAHGKIFVRNGVSRQAKIFNRIVRQ